METIKWISFPCDDYSFLVPQWAEFWRALSLEATISRGWCQFWSALNKATEDHAIHMAAFRIAVDQYSEQYGDLIDQRLLWLERQVDLLSPEPSKESVARKSNNHFNGWVYFVKLQDNIKIGYTKDRDIRKRIVPMKMYIVGEPELLGAIMVPDNVDIQEYELQMHAMFWDYHIEGELFSDSEEIREFAASKNEYFSER